MKPAYYKEKNLKVPQDKKSLTYKCRHINLAANLCAVDRQARKDWNDLFNALDWEKKCKQNILCSKAASQNRKREFPGQTKTIGICEH